MSNPSDDPISVPFARLTPLLEQALAADIDVEELFATLNLPAPSAGLLDYGSISLADYYRIQNRLSILFGDETLHLSSRQLLPGSTDFVLQHIHDCKTISEVMRVIAKSYNLLHGGQYNTVITRPYTIDYIIDDHDFPYAGNQTTDYIYFSIECILIFLHCMLMTVTPSAEHAIRGLHIRRPSPGGDCGHLGYWDAPIRFGANIYKVAFDRDFATQPVTIPPPRALTSNAVYQKIIDVVAGVRARRENLNSTTSLVQDSLGRGVVEQTDIASQMGVSVATLRRRLSEEGVSFRDLRRTVLNQTAKRLLSENQTTADIAEAIGFSDARAFNRAFKDWNGVTPKDYLKQHRDAPKLDMPDPDG